MISSGMTNQFFKSEITSEDKLKQENLELKQEILELKHIISEKEKENDEKVKENSEQKQVILDLKKQLNEGKIIDDKEENDEEEAGALQGSSETCVRFAIS